MHPSSPVAGWTVMPSQSRSAVATIGVYASCDVENQNLLTDLKLLVLTPWVVVSRKGAY
jgi:hypothetical protein